MINAILHAFDLHLIGLCEMNKHKVKIKRLNRKVKRLRDKNSVLTDIAVGIKRQDLEAIYKRVFSVKALIDKFTAQRNIFV